MLENVVSVHQGELLVLYKNLQDRIICSSTTKEILLKYEINGDTINIMLNREQRPDTCIVGSQGDHVTAYTVLLQLICNLIDGEEEINAPRILYNAVGCFFDDLEILEFKSYKTDQTIDFKTKLKEIEAKLFNRAVRKNLSKSLQNIQKANFEFNNINNPELLWSLNYIRSNSISGNKQININKLNSSIKRGNRVLFAQLVVELGEQILKKYNQKSTATLPKLKQDFNKPSTEGNRVKQAMLTLKLLDKFLKLKLNNNNTQSINNFKLTCKDIIKTSMPTIKDEKTINNKFNNLLTKLFNLEDISKNHKISLNNIDLYLDKISIVQSINTKEIGKLFNDLFDFKQKTVKQINLTDPLACLYEVTARHRMFMFKAFSNLDNLASSVKQKIMDSFYDKIIDQSIIESDNCQGWGAWQVYDNTTGIYSFFNKQMLANGVNEYNNKHVKRLHSLPLKFKT